MKPSEEITFDTTANHYPEEGGVINVDVRIKMNVVGNQIFYHAIRMNFEKRSLSCGILLLKNAGLFSNQYNYTFQHEKKDYYLRIDI
ncbi:MAG: hypothetical protein LBV71_05000 [Prevotella sp.]|jgi:hypothetical protein|nr:hypothetical protein [Prevotella sp.]